MSLAFIDEAVALISKFNLLIENTVINGGDWAYIIMFVILYAGAAFVVTAPLLPSVSLIFLVASLSVAGFLNPFVSFIVLVSAIVLGDLTSYFLGKGVRCKLLDNCRIPFIKKEHINFTKNIYEKSDFISIVLARFTPLIGSLAQMVAGAVNHKLSTFCARNLVAGVIWLIVYFVGGWVVAVIPAFKNNFVLIFMVVPVASGIVSVAYYITRNFGILALSKRA